jgi:hypothetical protein
MQTKDLEDAVRKVLPAVNLRPEGFELDAGFLQRALRSGQARVVNMNSPARLFVYLGEHGSHDPQAGVEGLASEALATLTDYARQCCEHLVVGWNNTQGQVFAAAFAVAPDGRSGALTASSWTNPETWREPMIDISKPADDAIHQLLARLQALVENHANHRDSKFHVEIKRVLKLTDMQLLLAGGENQSIDALPPTGASDAAWASWLADFKLSVQTEWARIGGAQRSAAAVAGRNPNGPLKGMLVFLSYRRTDATLLALPIYQALVFCGAEVWFDRVQLLDQSVIDVGLAAAITKCDAYILCASDEFFEGSGYATQEFAWAVRGRTPVGKLQRFAVVVAPGAVLPDAIASWPTIAISKDVKELARRLADALLQPTPFVPGSPSRVMLPPPAVLTPLPRQADLPHLFRRARHTQWFEELPGQDIERLIAQGAKDRQTQVLREKLLQLCDGADWNGTLQDIHQWPDDPLIRDTRLRFAAVRAVCGARWPLNDDLSCKLGVAQDVEYLATQRIPIMDWPGAVGWDDNERRFALRHHVGILRLLQTLLKRRFAFGLSDIGTSTLDAWEEELTVRRRECYDAILALRLDDRLSWEDVLTWDRPFRAWRDVLLHGASTWRGPVPPQVLQLLAANATAVAAVAAEVGWYVSRRGGLACQSFPPQAVGVPTSIDVYTFARTGQEYRPHPPAKNTVRVGLVADVRDRKELRVEWNAPQLCAPLPAGVGSRAAPEALSIAS